MENGIMRAFGNHASDRPQQGRMFGRTGAIATQHYLSAQAGMDILKAGGNAFDAAAAATLVEALVNQHMFSLGGECPMLLSLAGQSEVVALNGNTTAPRAATPEAFAQRGLEEIPPSGVLAAGPPTVFAALCAMLERYGSLHFSEIAAPALMLAADGFPAHEGLLSMPRFGIRDNHSLFRDTWLHSGDLFLTDTGDVPHPGALLRNPAMANLFMELVAAAGRVTAPARSAARAREHFYKRGPAQAMAAFVQQRRGLLHLDDIMSVDTPFEQPWEMEFLGARVSKCGPWCQGPVFLQLLRLLEGYDLAGMGHNSAAYLHHWVEAAKLAYADREQYYGDPERTQVDKDALLSRDYAALRRTLLDPERASMEHRPGDPAQMRALLPQDGIFMPRAWGPGTVHVAVADAHGNLAALTPSGGWCSGNEIVPELGFALGTRLQSFSLTPGHPNVVAPGKRPRTTLSPGMASLPVFESQDKTAHRPACRVAFGTMGGDQQDQWTSQFLLNMLVFGMAPHEAVAAPKVTSDHFPGTFHPHTAYPGRLRLESRIPPDVVQALAAMGHGCVVEGPWSAGYICAAIRYADGGLESAADPRGNSCQVFPATALAW